MKFNKYVFAFTAMMGLMFNATAQIDTLAKSTPVSVQEYLLKVGKENLGYAAQQYNINIAEAGIESAKAFSDPQLVVGVFDNQQTKLQLGQGLNVGLNLTLELGGKRNARINLAKSQTALNKALLQDYFRNLRADATIAYYNAVHQHFLLEAQRYSYHAMKQLADADAIRFKLGVITETDARQSKLEANNLLNALYQTEADWKNSLISLKSYTGKNNADSLLLPTDKFEYLERNFNYQLLIKTAQESRADAVAASNAQVVADKNLLLVKANRKIDLGLNAGMQYNTASVNEIAPTPYHRTASAGLTIPLKFANYYKGDLKAAAFTIRQTALQHDQVLQQIQTEVSQAYFNYTASQKQALQYKSGLLEEAKKILTAKVYTYKRGESSLLEVLNALRTFNEIQQGYYASLANYAGALVALERAAGIWDIK